MSFEHAEAIIESSKRTGINRIKIVHHHGDNWCNLSDDNGHILAMMPLSLSDYDKLLNVYMSHISELNDAGSIMYLHFRN